MMTKIEIKSNEDQCVNTQKLNNKIYSCICTPRLHLWHPLDFMLCLIGGCESSKLMILQAPQPLILNSLKSIIVERWLFKIYNHWQRFVESHNCWETVHAPGVVRKALTVEKRLSPNTEEKLNHHRWCRTLHQDGQSICKFQKSLIRTKKKKKNYWP